jgi:hypothetical protein
LRLGDAFDAALAVIGKDGLADRAFLTTLLKGLAPSSPVSAPNLVEGLTEPGAFY